MKFFPRFVLLFSISLLLISCGKKEQTADLVLLNGNIITLEDSLPNASAIAIKGDTIMAVGKTNEIKKLVGEQTEVLDLKGKTAIPGFVESHAHFMSLGKSLRELDLSTALNWNDVIAMVAEKADKARPGEWIIGRGWHQEKWDPAPSPSVDGYPIHDILSSASPYNPVLLKHASGHAIIANKKAMELAKIDTSVKAPEGGRIIRDTLGNATGVFEETAEYLISKVYEEQSSSLSPEAQLENRLSTLKLAEKECLENGITTFHDAWTPFATVDFYKEMIDKKELKVRIYAMLGEENDALKKNIAKYKIIGYGNNHLTVRAIKRFIDGALGSRGAWFQDPYNDLEEHFGLLNTPLNDLEETARIAAENGFQFCTHAIGDKGNHEILNIYEYEYSHSKDPVNLRWRVEHAQHLLPQDIPSFARLGIIAAMQGIHCTSDAPYVIERLGEERAQSGAYMWRTLIDNGTVICNGTDAPVEKINPIRCFYASVTRKTKDGSEFYPEQKMTRLEALKSYTINGAYAAFEENIKGSLAKGKLADITVLSQDILTVPEDEILSTKVCNTIIGGEILYSK